MAEGYRSSPDNLDTALANLITNPQRALELSEAEAVSLLASVGALDAILRARLSVKSQTAVREPPTRVAGRLLTLEQVSERSNTSRRWFVEHWKTLPFAQKIGRKILFHEQGFEDWLLCH